MITKSLASRLSAVSILIFGMSQVTAAAAALVRLPMSIKYLGTQEFGLLITIVAFLPWLSLLLGGSRITTRNSLSSLDASEVMGAWRFLLKRSFLMSLQLALPLAALGILSYFVGEQRFSQAVLPGFKAILILLVVYASGTPLFGTFAGGADALGKHNLYAGFGTVSALVSIPATWVGVQFALPLVWFVLVAAATYWLPALMIFLYFFQGIFRSKSIPGIQLGFVKTVTAASQGLGILFSSGLDVIVVAGTLGLVEAGSYGISTRLLGTIMIPAAALAPSQFRHFAQLRATHAPLHKVKRELRAVLIRNGALTLAIALCVLAIYGYVFRLMTHDKYPTNYSLGASLAVATILSAIFATFFAASAGDLGLRIGRNLSIAIGLLNLLSTIVLTKTIGVLGPAAASIACYGLGSVLWLWYVKRSPAFLTVV